MIVIETWPIIYVIMSRKLLRFEQLLLFKKEGMNVQEELNIFYSVLN
jgi:hypothetical protein